MSRAFTTAVVAAFSLATAAVAQEARPPRSVFDRMFGQSDRAAEQDTTGQIAQSGATEQVLRIERLEAQIRQMTGTIEQLQYRNRQLEDQLQRVQVGGAPPPPQAMPPVQSLRQPPSAVAAAPLPGPAAMPAPASPAPGRRDVFDPSLNPGAPGVPRPLGSIPAVPAEPPPVVMAEPQVGVPGGRNPGSPLDLSTLATPATAEPGHIPVSGPLPPPPSRNTSATGAVAAVAPPSETPKDYYDLGHGYIMRKDYALAETTFQAFLKKFPNDKLVPDAQFWIGESLFQRQRYDAAAQAFLDLSTKHGGHGKAADAMLRLGQSLAALGQKDMACATLAEAKRKYPRASGGVKQGLDREQKRAGC